MATSRRSKPRHGVAQTRGGVELAGGAFDQLTRRIHEFHRAISDIPFDRLAQAPVANLGSRPTRVLHDNITDSVYASVRAAGGLAFGLAALALKRAELQFENSSRTPAALPAPDRSVAPAPDSGVASAPAVLRDNVVAALNGAFGDFIAARRNPLAVQLAFYERGQPLTLTTAAIGAAHPQAGSKIVVFIHGLCCNEHSWRIYADPDAADSTPYGERLAAEHGYTPFYLRYNTGLHISQNGRALARAMAKLVAAYPLPIEDIVLVGHSMGGLVARSACHYGLESTAAWTEKVCHVICLGTPHLGAPLEQVVHLGSAVMDAFKLSRPWSGLLKLRSLGIKDLRHGYASHSDWRGSDADADFENRRGVLTKLPQARYHFIGSSIGESESHWLGKLIGDGLVRLPSSTAHELADADTAVLYRAHHMRLLNHPVVYQQLVQRLEGTAPAAPAEAKPATARAGSARRRTSKAASKVAQKAAPKAAQKAARDTATETAADAPPKPRARRRKSEPTSSA